jgi:hypothetical protein
MATPTQPSRVPPVPLGAEARESRHIALKDVANRQWWAGGPASTRKLWFSVAQMHPTPAIVRKAPVRK